ncbi:hypothetical protein TELCIR_04717 [Teladorsagia circumcincta]|uniref:Uncharacterized protein n=1 Tax=Teladorsagia circumcincta TaxID=45464 RepID=A0A2G9UUY0_TELCI|nr:hypothetical protein TELCIR_04717 [Teladorsagia circumcincta]
MMEEAQSLTQTAYSTQQQWGRAKIQKQMKLRECLNGDYETHKYLRKSTERQIGRINKRLGCRVGVENSDRFMSLVEVVAAEVKGNPNFNFNDGATFNSFQGRIMMEIPIIKRLAASRSLTFADEYKILYHYRKHGAEFMELCSPQFYIGAHHKTS